MILINIGTEYSVFVSAILKDWKDETINLIETVLQIIRHFEFMESNEKSKKVFLLIFISRPSVGSRPFFAVSKGSCKNQEYINKGLTTHYINCYRIKYPDLSQKYALN